MQDFPISELRMVNLWFKGSHAPTHHYMHESQVPTFVEASVKLHFELGNIHITDRPSKPGEGVALLWRVTVQPFAVETRSYWWCSPNLHARGERKDLGADLNDPIHSSDLWKHPDLIEEDKVFEAMED